LFFTSAKKLPVAMLKTVVLLGALLVMFIDVAVRFWSGGDERQRSLFIIIGIAAPLICFWMLLTAFASITFHHMLSTLPFVYLALGYVCERTIPFLQRLRRASRATLVVALPCALILASVAQQQAVVSSLRRSGGLGYFNERIGQIPLLSAQYYPGTYIVFAEWGFHLPFLFLTAGKVPFAAPFGDPNTWMERVLNEKRSIVICALPARTTLLAASARQAGAAAEIRPVKGRDGHVVFNFIYATMPSPTPSPTAPAAQPAPPPSVPPPGPPPR
jgi:hypothetical protein